MSRIEKLIRTYDSAENQSPEEFRSKYPVINITVAEGQGETRTIKKVRLPNNGLLLILAQRHILPRFVKVAGDDGEEREIRVVHAFYNPISGRMEDRNVQDIIFDASIPEERMRRYEYFEAIGGKESKTKLSADLEPALKGDLVILLLGLLGYAYPTNAIAEVTGMTKGTANRIVSTLAGDGFIANATIYQIKGSYKGFNTSKSLLDDPNSLLGQTRAYEGQVYRDGILNESYRLLTRKGRDRYDALIRLLTSRSGAPYYQATPQFRFTQPPPQMMREPPIAVAVKEEPAGAELIGRGGKLIGVERGSTSEEPLTASERDYYLGDRGMIRGITPFNWISGAEQRRKLTEAVEKRYKEEERGKKASGPTWSSAPESKPIGRGEGFTIEEERKPGELRIRFSGVPTMLATSPSRSISAVFMVVVKDDGMNPSMQRVMRGSTVRFYNVSQGEARLNFDGKFEIFGVEKGRSKDISFENVGTYEYWLDNNPKVKGVVYVT